MGAKPTSARAIELHTIKLIAPMGRSYGRWWGD